MRILIGCEFSGIVRDAFAALGHDAWSCDLLPSDRPGNHFQCDIREVISMGWDMAAFFPPCTFVCGSGIHWNNRGRGWDETYKALDFVRILLDCSIGKIVLENPVGLISSRIRKPTQIIQPYEFGDDASKKTCLWLKNLPKLVSTGGGASPDRGMAARFRQNGQALGQSNRFQPKQLGAISGSLGAAKPYLSRYRGSNGATMGCR